MTPFEVGFIAPSSTVDAWFVLNRLLDLVFVIDMALQFCVIYQQNERSEETGDDDKQALFQDLDGQLESKKALVCNSAITVGLNPTVKFGKVFLHTCRTGACIRDMYQLVHRIGRSEGGLSDTVIEVTLHDKPLEQKEAERQRAAAEGRDVTARPVFNGELSKIQDEMKGTSAYNRQMVDDTRSSAFSTHGGFDDFPEWYAKTAGEPPFRSSAARWRTAHGPRPGTTSVPTRISAHHHRE